MSKTVQPRDRDAAAEDVQEFEDANADTDRLGEDANAGANTLIGSRIHVLVLTFSFIVIEVPPKSFIS